MGVRTRFKEKNTPQKSARRDRRVPLTREAFAAHRFATVAPTTATAATAATAAATDTTRPPSWPSNAGAAAPPESLVPPRRRLSRRLPAAATPPESSTRRRCLSGLLGFGFVLRLVVLEMPVIFHRQLNLAR